MVMAYDFIQCSECPKSFKFKAISYVQQGVLLSDAVYASNAMHYKDKKIHLIWSDSISTVWQDEWDDVC